MRITIIRHGKVDMTWSKWSTSREFDQDCKQYDKAPICKINKQMERKLSEPLYVSKLLRSQETATALFGVQKAKKTALLNEVPLCSSFDCKRRLPLWFWNVTGRLQWLLYSKRQQESKRETVMRADRLIKQLIEKEEDSVIVTHGFYMRTLVNRLRKHGFYIDKKKIAFDNLDEIIAVR